MIIKTVKVSDKGQIAIPLEIREEVGINKGDELVVIQKGEKILIEQSRKFKDKVIDDFSDLAYISEKSLMKLWDNKEDEIWNQYIEK